MNVCHWRLNRATLAVLLIIGSLNVALIAGQQPCMPLRSAKHKLPSAKCLWEIFYLPKQWPLLLDTR